MKPFALLLGCGALTLAGVAQASTPVQISLPGVNLPSSNQVEGARASFLYGRTGQVKGIDLPVFALSDVDQFTGLQLGVFFGASRVRHQFGGVAILNAKGDSLRRRWERNFAGASAPLVLNVLLDHL